ncbi:IS3 family transposase, partial [Methylobacterium sp. C33D]
FAYIEGYYNRQRIHSALGYLTPEQAERTAK